MLVLIQGVIVPRVKTNKLYYIYMEPACVTQSEIQTGKKAPMSVLVKGRTPQNMAKELGTAWRKHPTI